MPDLNRITLIIDSEAVDKAAGAQQTIMIGRLAWPLSATRAG